MKASELAPAMSPPEIVNLPPGTWCLNGWKTAKGKYCSYTGGCYCDRENGHSGRCRCVCGSTSSTTPPEWPSPVQR